MVLSSLNHALITLSDNLQQIELEINHHKNIAGQSIWEIGRRLNHVKENDLAHGEFETWLNKINMSGTQARRFMKVSKNIKQPTSVDLGVNALYLIATLPEEEKQVQLERVEQGDNPTVRELQDLKRKLKDSEERNKQLGEKQKAPVKRTLGMIWLIILYHKEIWNAQYKCSQKVK